MSRFLRGYGSVSRDPAIDAWFEDQLLPLAAIAHYWFTRMRGCGVDVRELLHDGHPIACVDDAPFGYVDAFTAHVNVGLFRGAELPDPTVLREGSGRFMRHVKVRPGEPIDDAALAALVESAYRDMRRRVQES